MLHQKAKEIKDLYSHLPVSYSSLSQQEGLWDSGCGDHFLE
jgi:hypothetical protein